MIIHIFLKYNKIIQKFEQFSKISINTFLLKTKVVTVFYKTNDILWQEGLLIDYLQKKITNNLIIKFLINSAYLFNERFLFDKLIKFYLNLVIWPAQTTSVFDLNNVSNLFFFTIFTLFILFLSLNFTFLFFLMF